MTDDVKFVGKFKHKKNCDSPIVNPITEWCGGSYVRVIGYKCTKCRMETYLEDA